LSESLGAGVEVAARGGERGVAEDVSQLDDVGAVLDCLRGERVAHCLHADAAVLHSPLWLKPRARIDRHYVSSAVDFAPHVLSPSEISLLNRSLVRDGFRPVATIGGGLKGVIRRGSPSSELRQSYDKPLGMAQLFRWSLRPSKSLLIALDPPRCEEEELMAKTIVGLTSGKEFTVDEEVGGGWPPHSKNRPLGVVHRRRPAAADRSATVAFLREPAELEPAEDLSPRGPAPTPREEFSWG